MSSLGVEVISSDKKELIESIQEILSEIKSDNIRKVFLDEIRYIESNYFLEKESRKILSALYHALDIIKENIDKNKIVNDKFFKYDEVSETIYINELMDCITISIKNDYEEKKNKYYGYLLGNIIFNNDLDRDEINRLIRITKNLSYCQIKLIHMYIISQTIQVPILKREDYTKVGINNYKLLGLLQDTLELIQKGLLNGSGKLVLDVVQINPSKIKVQGLGITIYNILSINKMPYDELEDLLEMLSK